MFDSNAILLYLGEKTGQFMPGSVAPGAGGFVLLDDVRGQRHGTVFRPGSAFPPLRATEPNDYGATRYLFEAKRHYGILNDRLAKHEWMLGSEYTVVDMAVWGWGRMAPFVMGESPKDMSVWEQFPHVKRLMDTINARPAAARAEAIRDTPRVQDRIGCRGEAPHVPVPVRRRSPSTHRGGGNIR